MYRGKELLVGLFILLSIFSLVSFLFIFDKVNIENKFYVLNIEFNDVGSLEVGTPVILGGVKIGKVKKIYLEDEKVVVEVDIQNGVKIRKGAKVTILIKGLIGDLVLGVVNSNSEELYENGDTIEGDDPVSMNSLLEKTYRMLETMELLQDKLETVSFEDTTNIVNNLSNASKKLNETLDSTKKLTESADKLIRENDKSITLLIQNSNKLVDKIDILIKQRDKDLGTVIDMIKELLDVMKSLLKENEKDINKIVYNFEKISSKTLNLLESIDKKEIKEFYNDLKNITDEISEISKEVNEQLKDDSVKNLKKSIDNSKEITEKIKKLMELDIDTAVEIEYVGDEKSDFNLEIKLKKSDYFLTLKEEQLNQNYGILTALLGKKIEKNSFAFGILKEKGGLEYRYKLNANLDFNLAFYDNEKQNVTVGTDFSVKRYKIYLKYDFLNLKNDYQSGLRVGIGYEF